MLKGLKKVVALVLVLVLGVSVLAGCNKDKGKSELKGDTIVATVDGKEYRMDDLLERVNIYLSTRGYSEDDVDYATWCMGILQSWISDDLLVELAKEKGVTLTDEEYAESYEEICTYYGEDNFAEYLESVGSTQEFFEQTFKVDLLREKLKVELYGDKEPTEDEIKAWFEKYIDVYNSEDAASFYLIVAESKEKAEECKIAYANGTKTIAECYEEYNTDTTNGSEAQLFYVIKDHLENEEFTEAIWGTEIEKMSNPVEYTDGFYLFVPMEFTEAKEATLEESREYVIEDIRNQGMEDLIDSTMEEELDKHEIEYFVDVDDFSKSDGKSTDDVKTDGKETTENDK